MRFFAPISTATPSTPFIVPFTGTGNTCSCSSNCNRSSSCSSGNSSSTRTSSSRIDNGSVEAAEFNSWQPMPKQIQCCWKYFHKLLLLWLMLMLLASMMVLKQMLISSPMSPGDQHCKHAWWAFSEFNRPVGVF